MPIRLHGHIIFPYIYIIIIFPQAPCQFMVHRSRLYRKLGSTFYIPYGRGEIYHSYFNTLFGTPQRVELCVRALKTVEDKEYMVRHRRFELRPP